MRGTRQTTTPKTDRLQPEVPSVLLHQDVGGDLRGPEQRVLRSVDAEGLGDPAVVRMALGDLEAQVPLDQGQLVRRVAVDLVGRAEHEARVRAVPPRGLEQVKRPGRVDLEVGDRLAGGPVVRGLRGRVHHEIDRRAVAAKETVDRVAIADVDLLVGVAVEIAEQPLPVPNRRGLGPEEIRAQIVVDPDDVEPEGREVACRFAADQPRRTRDDGNTHGVILDHGVAAGIASTRPGGPGSSPPRTDRRRRGRAGTAGRAPAA